MADERSGAGAHQGSPPDGVAPSGSGSGRVRASLRERVDQARSVDRATPSWSFDATCSEAAEVVADARADAELLDLLEAERDGMRTPDEGLLIEFIAAADRLVNHLGSLQASFVAELVDRRRGARGTSRTRDEIAARLATTGYSADVIVGRAAALATAPDVDEALDRGAISARKAELITEATDRLELPQARAVQEYGVGYAEHHTPPQLRRELEAAVLAVDPEGAERAHEREVTRRKMVLEPSRHGMSWVGAYVPAHEASAVYTCIDGIAADTSADDPRTLDQRRADAFCQIFRDILVTGEVPGGAALPDRQGWRPAVQVTATTTVLAGDDQTPAILHGYGPVTAASARRMAREGEIELENHLQCPVPRWPSRGRTDLLDPMRELLPSPREPGLPDGSDPAATTAWVHRRQREASRCRSGPARDAEPVTLLETVLGLVCSDSYAPSRRLRGLIVDRDQTCRFPGCMVPGWRCQIDHIVAFDPDLPAWAQTVESNLQLLCRHHHQGKTEQAFSVEREAWTGITTWRTRTGHVYARLPERQDLTALTARLRSDAAAVWVGDGLDDLAPYELEELREEPATHLLAEWEVT
ncbi:HNH endonuclease [Ruania suaedae]|uniref:HNH endonuclease signature motif containing protein n=1 Tax=Ruania suaedae TaxID=2897774 RepID=UPI001E507158|nr:HNH endonuclease signature motif containing protein [Ruania suaedae]UFU03690.1 HNH endonuclease [Ruania suaedae]